MPDSTPEAEEITSYFLADVAPWYESKRASKGGMNTNVMTIGLMLTDRMAEAFPLAETHYLIKARGQVKDVGGPRVRAILARHNEKRPFTSGGGRTSRGTIPRARELASVLNNSSGAIVHLGSDAGLQAKARHLLQGWFVDRVRFVGTNIEEIAAFAAPEIRSGLSSLLLRYNERVKAVEPDPSLQIEIPGNL